MIGRRAGGAGVAPGRPGVVGDGVRPPAGAAPATGPARLVRGGLANDAGQGGEQMLLALTLIVIAIVVVVLAGYLIAVARALVAARRNVAQLAGGLEAIAGHVGPLGDKLGPINAALQDLLAALGTVDRHLLGVAGLLRR